MGLAKGFRLLNLILLVVAAVLMLMSPLYYKTQHIVLVVKDGTTYKTVDDVYYVDNMSADNADYNLIKLDGEYAKIDSVTVNSESVSEDYKTLVPTDYTTNVSTTIDGVKTETETHITETTTVETYESTAKTYTVTATVYDNLGVATGVYYQFDLSDKDYELLGGIAKDDVYRLGVRSTSSALDTGSDLIIKYSARDVLVRYTKVTGAQALFSGEYSSKVNMFMFLLVLDVTGAIALLASLFLMRKRTEVVAANVVASVFGIGATILAGIYALSFSSELVAVGGTVLFLLSQFATVVVALVGLFGAVFAMKSKESKMLGKVFTTVGAIISVVYLFIFISLLVRGATMNALFVLLPFVGTGLALTGISILTILLLSKSQRNEKLNENGVIEEDNTYVDPNAPKEEKAE